MEKFKIDWDGANCTYRWVITLDKMHPENYSQNTNLLFGFSKAKGTEEPKDKFQLLMTKVLMLNRKYFYKSLCVEIFIKEGGFMNLYGAMKILKLYPTKYEINPICINDESFYKKFFIDGGIKNFLDRLYHLLKNQKDLSELKPKSKRFELNSDYLDVDKVSFTSKEQLFKYAENLRKNKHEEEDILNFVNGCLAKYFKK